MDDRADPEAAAIEALVQDYFLGMYEGDVERLRRIFHPQCWLFGENPRGSHAFPVAGFIDQIASEPVPEAEGEPFDIDRSDRFRCRGKGLGPLSGPPLYRLLDAPEGGRWLAYRRQAVLQPGLMGRPSRGRSGGGSSRGGRQHPQLS
jgi:hypothetical protein